MKVGVEPPRQISPSSVQRVAPAGQKTSKSIKEQHAKLVSKIAEIVICLHLQARSDVQYETLV